MSADRVIVENAFFVLGCDSKASRAEIERAAAKLLGLLAVGAAAAKTYETPLGPRERTADLVRAAAAELRDPERRIAHEIWARANAAAAAATTARDDATYPEALALLGWPRR